MGFQLRAKGKQVLLEIRRSQGGRPLPAITPSCSSGALTAPPPPKPAMTTNGGNKTLLVGPTEPTCVGSSISTLQ